jgi:hypothetical protein
MLQIWHHAIAPSSGCQFLQLSVWNYYHCAVKVVNAVGAAMPRSIRSMALKTFVSIPTRIAVTLVLIVITIILFFVSFALALKYHWHKY